MLSVNTPLQQQGVLGQKNVGAEKCQPSFCPDIFLSITLPWDGQPWPGSGAFKNLCCDSPASQVAGFTLHKEECRKQGPEAHAGENEQEGAPAMILCDSTAEVVERSRRSEAHCIKDGHKESRMGTSKVDRKYTRRNVITGRQTEPEYEQQDQRNQHGCCARELPMRKCCKDHQTTRCG